MGKSRYKKLEMLIFAGVNPESWVYRAKHFFKINDLADAMVSFDQDEVNWF